MKLTLEKRVITTKEVNVHEPGKIEKFIRQGWTVVEVDGEEPVGLCEVCWLPIKEGDVYQGPDEDGCVLCQEHGFEVG